MPNENPWHATTTVVRRDDVEDWLAGERGNDSGDILVFGSRTMWNGLLQRGLVDELHLMIGPAAIGGGTPTFVAPTELSLLDVRRFDGSDNRLVRYAAHR